MSQIDEMVIEIQYWHKTQGYFYFTLYTVVIADQKLK